jgi:hypothetical protein
MIKSDLKLNELAAVLKKDDRLIITGKVEELRTENPFEGAVGLLIEYFDKTEDNVIKKSISSFLNDIKDQSVCNEVVAQLKNPLKASTLSMIVSSCWQSGLDYSGFSTDFVKTFLDGDYSTAIECITVIEESAMKISRTQKDELIGLIENSPEKPGNETNALREEMLLILER